MKNSQLRQDLVSGDWILIAPGRRRRPHELVKKRAARKKAPLKGCPFENPQKSGQGTPFFVYANKKDEWQVQVFENKYPALTHSTTCAVRAKKGPFSITQGVGHQDLIVTRDHNNNFSHLRPHVAYLVVQAFRERYRMLSKDSCIAYVSTFHNWGSTAGASLYHPHYQMIALPIVPPDVAHSIRGSSLYFKKHKKCVHCTMISWERKEKNRVVYENEKCIVIAPFVSRTPFELRIFPKAHQPFFEDISSLYLRCAADALQKSLRTIEKKLKDPDYNFFIHTSPIAHKKRYAHYHWHIEIVPRISIQAGFELGTDIDINVVDPDEAAKLLRIRKNK